MLEVLGRFNSFVVMLYFISLLQINECEGGFISPL